MRVNPNPQDANGIIRSWDAINSPPATNTFSVQAVTTHEFGHFVNLRDIYETGCSNVTMYWGIAPGQDNEKTLDIGDLSGLNWQYP